MHADRSPQVSPTPQLAPSLEHYEFGTLRPEHNDLPHGMSRRELQAELETILVKSDKIIAPIDVNATAKMLARLIPERRTQSEVSQYMLLLYTYGFESRHEAKKITKHFFSGSGSMRVDMHSDPVEILRQGIVRGENSARPDTRLRHLYSSELKVLEQAVNRLAGKEYAREMSQKVASTTFPASLIEGGLIRTACIVSIFAPFGDTTSRLHAIHRIIMLARSGRSDALLPGRFSGKGTLEESRLLRFLSAAGRMQSNFSVETSDNGSYSVSFSTGTPTEQYRALTFENANHVHELLTEAVGNEQSLEVIANFVCNADQHSWLGFRATIRRLAQADGAHLASALDLAKGSWELIAYLADPTASEPISIPSMVSRVLNDGIEQVVALRHDVDPHSLQVCVQNETDTSLQGLSSESCKAIDRLVDVVAERQLLQPSGANLARTAVELIIAETKGALSFEQVESLFASLVAIGNQPDTFDMHTRIRKMHCADGADRELARKTIEEFFAIGVAINLENQQVVNRRECLLAIARCVVGGFISRQEAVQLGGRICAVCADVRFKELEELESGLPDNDAFIRAIQTFLQLAEPGVERGLDRELILAGSLRLATHVARRMISVEVAHKAMELAHESEWGVYAQEALWKDPDRIRIDSDYEARAEELGRKEILGRALGQSAHRIFADAVALGVSDRQFAECQKFYHSAESEVLKAEVLKRMAHGALVKIVRGELQPRDALAWRYLRRYRADSVPYSLSEAKGADGLNRAETAHRQTMEIMYRAFERYYGASSYTFSARRIPGEESSLLADFGRECGRNVLLVRCDDKQAYPGSGLVIDGLRLENIFAPDRGTSDEPYLEVKLAWPWAASVLEDTAASQLVYLRGMRAVIPPMHDDYCLAGTHYALVALNEHFHDLDRIGVFLVDSSILRAALAPSLVPHSSSGGTELQSAVDILQQPVRFEDLEQASIRKGVHLLRLTWPSNLGGLSNVFPARSSPYFDWEKQRTRETKDAAGHVHKSHRLGRYRPRTSPELEEALEPLREAHSAVYRMCDRLYAIEDVFRLARAQFHKGLTSPDGFMVSEEYEVEASDFDPREFLTPGELVYSRHGGRMLEMARRWHRSLHGNGIEDKNAYPVLVAAPALNDWERFKSFFSLDTFDLTLRDEAGEHAFDRGDPKLREFDEMQWMDRVWQKVAARSDLDLRFIDRRQL